MATIGWLETGHPTHVHVILAHGHRPRARVTHDTLDCVRVGKGASHIHLHLQHRVHAHAHTHIHLRHAHLRGVRKSSRVGHCEWVLSG